MQRRDFLRSAGCASVAMTLPFHAVAAQQGRASPVIGLQLISVLAPLGVDFRQTLCEVAAIGYGEVETLGSLGRPPAEVFQALQACGLRSPAQHLVPDELFQVFQRWDRGSLSLPQAIASLQEGYALTKLDHILEQGIERALAMQQQFLIWPVLFDDQVASPAALRAVTRAFDRAGELCRRAGLTFAFHTGSNASRRLGQARVYELILEQTDPMTVKMELDTYYLGKSGTSASAFLSKHPQRCPLLHLKDVDNRGQIADLGRGEIDFAALLRTARRSGVQYAFVEHDRAADPVGSARASWAFVKRL
jgi:Xylose isomerase-like TIM barrel